jgi:hypothetical protein
LLELQYKRQIVEEMAVKALGEGCRSFFVGLDPQKELTFEIGSGSAFSVHCTNAIFLLVKNLAKI